MNEPQTQWILHVVYQCVADLMMQVGTLQSEVRLVYWMSHSYICFVYKWIFTMLYMNASQT